MTTMQERWALEAENDKRNLSEISARMRSMAKMGVAGKTTASLIRREVKMALKQAPTYLSSNDTQDFVGDALEGLDELGMFEHCKAVEAECEKQELELAVKIKSLEAEIDELRNMAIHASAIRSAHCVHRCIMKAKEKTETSSGK